MRRKGRLFTTKPSREDTRVTCEFSQLLMWEPFSFDCNFVYIKVSPCDALCIDTNMTVSGIEPNESVFPVEVNCAWDYIYPE